MKTITDIRYEFIDMKNNDQYVVDKTGCKMLELIGATFVADEDVIFGAVNDSYVKRELEWYSKMSLNIYDIPGGDPPREWVNSADPEGNINSNYGWLIWSSENNDQYANVRAELTANPNSRRAVMIYTRPSMWSDYKKNGMNDFICTNTVQFMLRDDELICVVQMRSNDVVYGYKNDRAWHKVIHERLANDLSCKVGRMIWHAGSLHVYERHFKLVV